MADKTLSANSGSYTTIGAPAFRSLVLVVAVGAYSLTGTAVSVTHGHPLTAAVGSYTVTGQAISTRRLTAEPAAYQIQGQAATLTSGVRGLLIAGNGTYAITGSTTHFIKSIGSARGSYVTSGTAATLTRSTGTRTVVASVGSYSITGVGPTLELKIPSGSGEYLLTGTSITTRLGKGLLSNPGVYTVSTLNTTKLEQSRHFNSVNGTYAVTGGQVQLVHSTQLAKLLVANIGSYSVSNPELASLFLPRSLVVDSGSYAVSGTKTLNAIYLVPGVYGITGTEASLRKTGINAEIGAYTLSGSPVLLTHGISRLQAESGVYIVGTPAIALSIYHILPADSGVYTLGPVDIGLRSSFIHPETGQYTYTGQAVTFRTLHTKRWHHQPKGGQGFAVTPATVTLWKATPHPPGVETGV